MTQKAHSRTPVPGELVAWRTTLAVLVIAAVLMLGAWN
ncbi:hypothetical protein FB471_1014 [Amycolatopsis cihanbeyliensis]|uniref:Uncharacterized protein n=1 Tax=Amycolatopsis cihanbeyliensis TaxID=1128664 RepID=A0A542DE73_AMYCI|nr:hypothetical protein FB471_1014 [Amycolatopsis cihanbeyliensis]